MCRAPLSVPPLTNMPDGAGTHVLKPNGHPWYYDTAISGGVGGKANTRIGDQTATWQGSNIINRGAEARGACNRARKSLSLTLEAVVTS